MNFQERQERVKQLVERVLVENEEARNNDWIMIFDALEKGSGIKLPAFYKNAILDSKINPHSLLRQRRIVQKEMRNLKPTNPIIEAKRKKLSKEYLKYLKNSN